MDCSRASSSGTCACSSSTSSTERSPPRVSSTRSARSHRDRLPRPRDGHAPLMREDVAERIGSLAKRRGFVFPSSEIYGGAGSTWDYGPLGVELKNNIKRSWWRAMVQLRDDVVGLDAAIIMHPRVWEASGHVENFTDPLVECGNCKQRFRLDELPDGDALATDWRATRLDLSTVACPNCGQRRLADPRRFNLTFKTFVGP